MFSRRFIQGLRYKRISTLPRHTVGRSIRLATVSPSHSQPRSFATRSIADEKIEEIQEIYATAKDEFEIAAEETEKMTVYAEDDRQAAREELEKLKAAYKTIVDGPDRELGQEVQSRIGQRIRELDNAVHAMEELAKNQD